MSKTTQIHQPIIDACKNNNAKAQMQLYKLYCNAMLAVANRYLKDPYLAEDVMQDAFIKCFKKIGSYQGEVAFGAWLKRIVINQCIDELKRKKLSLAPLNEEISSNIEEENDWRVDDNVLVTTIVEVIQDLKDKYRLVLTLFLLEGYDHQEISQILGITENTSRTHLLRGKKMVQDQLKNNHHEERY